MPQQVRRIQLAQVLLARSDAGAWVSLPAGTEVIYQCWNQGKNTLHKVHTTIRNEVVSCTAVTELNGRPPWYRG